MIRSTVFVVLMVGALTLGEVHAQRTKPAVPDLVLGGRPDGKHDWNLGATGARGWIWGWKLATTDARQILITEVEEGTPAAGRLRVGDVVVGLDGVPFGGDARRLLGEALTRAEGSSPAGRVRLLVERNGDEQQVELQLPVLGDYAPSAPWDCPKSAAILDRACEHIAAHGKGDIDGMMNALALLATGREEYRDEVAKLAHEVGDPALELSLGGRTSGLFSWQWGYRNLFLCEYYLATGDASVMPAILEYSETMAQGQSGVGTWGHGMAWPDLNEGRLHGSLGGYGALNQAGLVCHLSLVLARKCGVQSEEIDAAIVRANSFASFYAGKGAIPYGDHRPGWDMHDDNGKNSLAAIIFDLQGFDEEADFFARMTVASYGEREHGHTGNYFSYLWGALGAARRGPLAAAAFLKEQRWYYDLARNSGGGFDYQGGAGMEGGEHKYGDWDCTGAFVLANTLPLQTLYITGRGRSVSRDFDGKHVAASVLAGRGFHSWDKGRQHYGAMPSGELIGLLRSWSPAVRSRAAVALAAREEVPVADLVELLQQPTLNTQYGACQGLGALGRRARSAVPALTAALTAEDLWLRIQAALALAAIGEPARSAVPDLLRLAVSTDEEDPREFTQRYLAFCLFYRGGALGMRGLLAKSLDGVDRGLLLPAVERLLRNDDGRARAAVESVYRHLTLEEVTPLLPAVVHAIRVPSPSGVMFSNGIRLSGLELLARHHIREGMSLAFPVIELQKWGKQDRIRRVLRLLQGYGAAAQEVLPELRALKVGLEQHRERNALQGLRDLCVETIAEVEASLDEPVLRSLDALVAQQDNVAVRPKLKVFILAGQSNMVGAGEVRALPERNGGRGSLRALVESDGTKERYGHLVDEAGDWVVRDDVWISYFEREGGLSVGYGSRADTIGPELGFGHVVGDAYAEPVLLLKVAWGGKSIGKDFRPPSAGGEVGESYRQLFAQVRAVLGSLDDRFPSVEFSGYEVMGIAWHQGWNDRVHQAFNDAYEHNLSCFIRDARRELGLPRLPFVIAETGMSGHGETHPRALSLMRAQAAVAASEEFRGTTAFVGTRDFYRPKEESPSGQGYHWNSNAETYYLIGEGLGRAMLGLCR